ncbi:hypothetical protein PR202_gb16149 [Eleusine coracana subsp. coracana]|uniref:TF-B3 domain-containing protein n=1 Tax=Eleusine coracana subsp. coracana TaxID=191504 RepID=A0AAV5EZP0_ELECO|nr:hypothetical protein PR202_gb16149 [Eleusine coracana subsp. coracana]
MTKGWSRYVHDKRLAASDTVSFFWDGARLYIDCHRRAKRPIMVALVLVPAQIAALLFGNSNTVQRRLAPPAVVNDEDAHVGRAYGCLAWNSWSSAAPNHC